MPVAVANDRGTFRGTITYGVRESYLVEEVFHFTVEGGSANDNLIEITSESIHHLLADALVHLFADDRHIEQQP